MDYNDMTYSELVAEKNRLQWKLHDGRIPRKQREVLASKEKRVRKLLGYDV